MDRKENCKAIWGGITMDVLQLSQIYKGFSGEAGEKQVLRGVSLAVPQGGLVTLLGRSGCGKTTLLRIAASFEQADRGDVLFEGQPVRKPDYRRFMVFQSYDQIFPWMRVADNIIFALRAVDKTLTKAQALEQTRFWLGETGLTDCERQWPRMLSGGMKQRAALARAFAVQPRLLLLDEPFAGLDQVLRRSMQTLLLTLCQKHGMSALFVTHDVEEALYLSEKPAVLRSDGREIVFVERGSGTMEAIQTLLAQDF